VPPLPWVKVSQQGITVEGKPIRFIGAVTYYAFYTEYGYSIEEAMRTARETGITVLKIGLYWGNVNWVNKTYKEFDRVLDLAAKYGIYIVVTLIECAPEGLGGLTMDTYFDQVPHCDVTSQPGQDSFKSYINRVFNRRNTINGKIWKDDPTIFAWEVAKDIQINYFSASDFSKWLGEVVAYIKASDPYHLVIYRLSVLEFSDGQRHPEVYDLPGIDILNVGHHTDYQPGDNGVSTSDTNRLMTSLQVYVPLGKPIILEESGAGSQRQLKNVDKDTLDGWLQAYRDLIDTAFSAGASGYIFWGWEVPGTWADPSGFVWDGHNITETEFCTFIRSFQKRNLTPQFPGGQASSSD
jgi:endo-1,4-beta-mannosidase